MIALTLYPESHKVCHYLDSCIRRTQVNEDEEKVEELNRKFCVNNFEDCDNYRYKLGLAAHIGF